MYVRNVFYFFNFCFLSVLYKDIVSQSVMSSIYIALGIILI